MSPRNRLVRRGASLAGPVLAIALTACGGLATAPGGSATPAARKPAPNFAEPRLGGGGPISIAGQRGHVVLLSSWATWCAECRNELPAIQRLADRFGPRGLRVIGVNVNAGNDQGPLKYASDRHLRFTMVHDTANDFQQTFSAVGVPTSVLIDKHGRVVAIWPGALDTASAEPVIARTLREP